MQVLRENETLGGLARLTFQMTNVAMPHKKMLKSIKLLGDKGRPFGEECPGLIPTALPRHQR